MFMQSISQENYMMKKKFRDLVIGDVVILGTEKFKVSTLVGCIDDDRPNGLWKVYLDSPIMGRLFEYPEVLVEVD